jgi:hypothetical protein
MFVRKKKQKASGTRRKGKKLEILSGSDGDSSSDSDDADEGDLRPKTDVDDGKEWGKKVDEVLREYISTEGCRTAVSDKHFNNPPRSSQSKENKWG